MIETKMDDTRKKEKKEIEFVNIEFGACTSHFFFVPSLLDGTVSPLSFPIAIRDAYFFFFFSNRNIVQWITFVDVGGILNTLRRNETETKAQTNVIL